MTFKKKKKQGQRESKNYGEFGCHVKEKGNK